MICSTNLDLRGESWPNILPALPRVGDRIQSATKHRSFQLELEVHRVTFKQITMYNQSKEWIPEIELHMTSFHKMLISKDPNAATGSITAFYEWYAPLVGSYVGAFI